MIRLGFVRPVRGLLTVVPCVVALATGCASVEPPASFAARLPPFQDGARLVVVGDLQRTAPILEFWREQNDVERSRVVSEIAAERPDLVLVTGDCVFDGASSAEWTAFDRLTAPWRTAALPVASAFGNHEYWGGRAEADAHLFPRFPLDEGRHWFAIAFGPLRVVVLDSNEGELGEDEWASELRWYEATLLALDSDAAVRGVLVAFHHPPVTNSTVSGDDPRVQRDLVPPFARARKTLAMLNGHVHSYERFVRGGKVYVVSGGGGGPRAALETGSARRHPDDVYPGPPLRDFHFSTYTITDRGTAAEVHGLARGATDWKVIDRFDLPWAP